MMLARIREAGLVWPTICAAAALLVLVSLGNWQWRRLAWKEDLIARLKAREAASSQSIDKVLGAAETTALEDLRFVRVVARGRFLHEHEFHVWAGLPSGPAWLVVTPLALSEPFTRGRSGERIDTVLVMRGIIPQALKDAAKRAEGQVDGERTITGRLRLPSAPGAFTAQPDIGRNEWYARDLDGMADVLRRARAGRFRSLAVAPLFIEAEDAAGGERAPRPDLAALALSNRHLEYALTWWGLALTLIGVYTAFAISRLRRTATGVGNG